MQVGKATLVEVNDERNAHKNVWQIVLFYFGISRETPEMARLRSSAAASEKKCSELEEKYHAAEFEKQAQGKKLATAYAAIAVLVVTVVLCMIFSPDETSYRPSRTRRCFREPAPSDDQQHRAIPQPRAAAQHQVMAIRWPADTPSPGPSGPIRRTNSSQNPRLEMEVRSCLAKLYHCSLV